MKGMRLLYTGAAWNAKCTRLVQGGGPLKGKKKGARARETETRVFWPLVLEKHFQKTRSLEKYSNCRFKQGSKLFTARKCIMITWSYK